MSALARFARSMRGHLFIVLLLGTSAAGIIALALADVAYRQQLSAVHIERVANRVEAMVALVGGFDDAAIAEHLDSNVLGLAPLPPEVEKRTADQGLARALDQRLPEGWSTTAHRLAAQACLRRSGRMGFASNEGAMRVAADRTPPPGLSRPICWSLELRRPDGDTIALLAGVPSSAARPRVLEPLFLAGLLILAAGLSLLVARLASRPLERLAGAAAALRDDLNTSPMSVDGPSEVAQAALALNSLQARLNAALEERSHILAAITHDLQTPLTRLRLRVEKVKDRNLKKRLLGDLAATQTLVREGLDLARDGPPDEPFAALALDSMLAAMADDEADAGRPVVFQQGCGCDVRVRPAGFRRCVENLIDNAVTHGGGAVISAYRNGDEVCIFVDDEGPGIPDTELARVVNPFVRLETSRSRDTGGSGLGLTIAARLAGESHGRLQLVNQPTGLSARVYVPAASRRPLGTW